MTMSGFRRAGLALLWAILLLIAAAVANVIGIHLVGSIDAWQQWMKDHAIGFLIWRLLLYLITVWGWLRMRRRVLAREPDAAAQWRLRRAELAAVIAVAALEIGRLMPE